MGLSSNLLWWLLLAAVFFAPAIIVACSGTIHGSRKSHWLIVTLVFSWIGFLGYLTAIDREFFD